MFDNVLKLQSNITMKWPPGNYNIHVPQKKSNTRGLCICYLKVIEKQVSLSAVLGTLRVCINSFSDILMVLKDPRFKSYERI